MNELYKIWRSYTMDKTWYVPGSWEARAHAVRVYSWAVPTNTAIHVLTRQPIVEIGAGTGYWARLVHEAGGDVVAYDPEPYQNRYVSGKHFPVRKGGTRSVAQHADRALFICWPPYNDGVAALALRTYRRAGGKKLFYVGEDRYGCTANNQFFDELEKHWYCGESLSIPRWDGIYDGFNVYDLASTGR
jgi:hypothetical protein